MEEARKGEYGFALIHRPVRSCVGRCWSALLHSERSQRTRAAPSIHPNLPSFSSAFASKQLLLHLLGRRASLPADGHQQLQVSRRRRRPQPGAAEPRAGRLLPASTHMTCQPGQRGKVDRWPPVVRLSFVCSPVRPSALCTLERLSRYREWLSHRPTLMHQQPKYTGRHLTCILIA